MDGEEQAHLENLGINLTAVCKVAIINLLSKVKEIKRDDDGSVIDDGGLYEFMRQLDFGDALEVGMGFLAEEYGDKKVANEINRRAMEKMREIADGQSRIKREDKK